MYGDHFCFVQKTDAGEHGAMITLDEHEDPAPTASSSNASRSLRL